VIRAKFVSFGDGKRIYLSTAGEELGVLYAKSELSGKLMLPYSWTEMICLKTGVKEKRKVAKPSSS
jgi:exosome complex component CSL4